MSSIEKPFIGVTGVNTSQEAKVVARNFERCLPPESKHQGAVGYRVNSYTLEGIKGKPAKHPDINALPEILSQTLNNVRNTIHYNTKDHKTLPEQVKRLFCQNDIYRDGLCKTLQLNVRWPEVSYLEAIKSALPELKIIFPLTPRTLNRQTREQIAENLRPYEDFIDYILIDPSGGRGTSFESGWIAPYYRLLKDNYPEKQIILAGGYDDENVLSRLAQTTYALMSINFGIDAETGLREPNIQNRYGKLSLPKVEKFIERASTFFSSTSDFYSGTGTSRG